MALLSLSNVSLYFGARPLFQDLSFQIAPKERIGLVGANGRGKTTLLRLIMGQIQPETGEISLSRGCRFGYLPQEMELESQESVLQFVLSSVGRPGEFQEEIDRAEVALDEATTPEEKEECAQLLSSLYEESLEQQSLYSSHEASMILAGLGFSEEDLTRPVDHFSGGWKMRVQLAALLFSKPDLLLLDEPTNHLDLPSLSWLDTYLKGWRKAYVIISHDRDFLDRHATRIFALEPEGFKAYKGNYSQSRLLRQEEERVLRNRRKNVERERKQMERFVERFKAQANKARQAKSKAKLIKRLEKVEVHKEEQQFVFSFPPVERAGDRVLVLDGISKSFGMKHLYSGVDMVVRRGERIGIVGVNGSGKTTLLRLIAGDLGLDKGSVTFGSQVTWTYYAQHQTEALDLGNTVIEEVRRVAPSLGETQVRSVLGAFLFRGEDVEKVVGVLSGGEKARVALAKLLVAPGNLLLMDEPTNHLDLESAESLAGALEGYGGTLLFVSHNRAFIDRLATGIWEVGEGRITEFPGNLSEYMEFLTNRDQVKAFTTGDVGRVTPAKGERSERGQIRGESRTDRRKREARERELLRNALGPYKKKIASLEARIEKLEARNGVLEKRMVDPELYGSEAFVNALKEFKENQEKVEELMARWTYQSDELERREAKLRSEL